MKTYLVYQYFEHPDEKRKSEIDFCLIRNSKVSAFDEIILLNEKIFKLPESMGIKQVIIGHRLKYGDVFKYAKENLPSDSIIVFCNADMFYDNKNIEKARLRIGNRNKCICLIRYEYKAEYGEDLSRCLIMEYPKPPECAQDTWIFHNSKNNLQIIQRTSDLTIGFPGCDNRLMFELSTSGFICENPGYQIRTYHNHASQIRNYTEANRIRGNGKEIKIT